MDHLVFFWHHSSMSLFVSNLWHVFIVCVGMIGMTIMKIFNAGMQEHSLKSLYIFWFYIQSHCAILTLYYQLRWCCQWLTALFHIYSAYGYLQYYRQQNHLW